MKVFSQESANLFLEKILSVAKSSQPVLFLFMFHTLCWLSKVVYEIFQALDDLRQADARPGIAGPAIRLQSI